MKWREHTGVRAKQRDTEAPQCSLRTGALKKQGEKIRQFSAEELMDGKNTPAITTLTTVAQECDVNIVTDCNKPKGVSHKITQEPV